MSPTRDRNRGRVTFKGEVKTGSYVFRLAIVSVETEKENNNKLRVHTGSGPWPGIYH